MIPEIEYYKLDSKDLKKLREMTYEMSKSQNTKNEQLTEQWIKGELPSGWYWVEGSRAEGIYAYTAEYLNNMYRPNSLDEYPIASKERWKKEYGYKQAEKALEKIEEMNK